MKKKGVEEGGGGVVWFVVQASGFGFSVFGSSAQIGGGVFHFLAPHDSVGTHLCHHV